MVDALRVEYPNDPTLRAIGRVAVIGVLLRLRTPMMAVEQFRNELDAAIVRAGGGLTSGTLSVTARWDEDEIEVEINGPGGTERLHRPRIRR